MNRCINDTQNNYCFCKNKNECKPCNNPKSIVMLELAANMQSKHCSDQHYQPFINIDIAKISMQITLIINTTTSMHSVIFMNVHIIDQNHSNERY
jgi:hypothetical protein